jgi:outer membrane immunogenic protein
MNRIALKLIAGTALGLGVMQAANSADLPIKSYPAAASVYNWTGGYFGVHVGAGWEASSFAGSGGQQVASGVGVLGGVQAGYNLQFRQFVIGLEGEFWGSGLSDRNFSSSGSGSSEDRARNTWDAALSVRSGIAFDRTFIYGKLGAVWGHFEYETSDAFSNFTFQQSGSKNFLGVLIGVGFEYALTDNWTTKFEYNYIDYGNHVVDFTPVSCESGACTTSSFSTALKETKQIAKLGVNYKFGANPAVAVAPAFDGPFNWTGFYAGLHGGAGWETSSFAGSGGGQRSGIGGLGGVQVGYNFQFRQFVVGVEGEFWGSSLSDRSFRSSAHPVFGTDTDENRARNTWDAALSVRSGIAFDRTFIYGKLGAVWGHFEYDSNGSFNNPECCSGSFQQEGSKNFLGVLIGVGFEYALANNWTTKFEYNYIDYGNKAVNFTAVECFNGACANTSHSETVKEVKQLAKLGLNYKF